MTTLAWYTAVGAALLALGLVTMLVAADRFRRLVALNVAAAGSLVILLAVAGRDPAPDPVLHALALTGICLLYTSPSPRDRQKSRMPSSA